MALIREVARHENSRMWAFIEYEDESEHTPAKVLGDKHFALFEDAVEYSKGFAPDSYVWNEPLEVKKSRLLKEKEELEARLRKINYELGTIKYIDIRDSEGEDYFIPEDLVDEFNALDAKILESGNNTDPNSIEEYYNLCDEFSDKFLVYKK